MNKNTKTKRLVVFFVTIALSAAVMLGFAKSITNNLTLGLDLQGGFEILYEVSPLEEGGTLPDMSIVANSVSKRVNVLGVSEPQIIIEGDNRIRVQLAGVENQEQARRMISAQANLTFRDVNDELLADASIIQEGGATLAFQDGRPVVSLKISDSNQFGDVTEQIAGMSQGNNLIVTWLDFEEGDSYKEEVLKSQSGQEPKYISAATVSQRLDGDCIISGNFTEAEARELADLISSGSLPVKMSEISSNVVSADYGMDALASTSFAGIVGVILVFAFMIFVYRLPGVIASIMLSIYIFAVFAIYSAMGAVFTLPGIAALVLGVGMTVDANIITFERICDELYKGRSVQRAVHEGQNLSFSTIFDAQFTTLLAGLIMYVFGNGAVKGFATMLMITVICTLVINVVVSRFLMNQLVNSGVVDHKKTWFGVKESKIPNVENNEKQTYFGPFDKIDFMKHAKKMILVSLSIFALALVMAGVNTVSGKGALNLGIDFSSGTKITVTAPDKINMTDVQATFNELGYEKVKYQAAGDTVIYATIKDALTTEQLDVIKAKFVSIYGEEPGDNVVTPIVGRDLVQNAIILSLLAWIAMLVYITLRFKWDYAVSCIVALLHDVGIVLAVFVIFRLEFNTELISVILAIIGYSINNSIVVFDRVREDLNNAKTHKHSPEFYHNIVNEALDNTIVRSIYSSFTTILPIICLLMLGSNAIFTFTFAMFVGLIAGTLSSIYIAPKVWFYIRTHQKEKTKSTKKKSKHKELEEYTIKGINA